MSPPRKTPGTSGTAGSPDSLGSPDSPGFPDSPAEPSGNTTSGDMHSRWTDERVEQWVSTLLRIGVLIAATITMVGGVLYLARYGFNVVNYATFRDPSPDVHTVSGIIEGVYAMDSRALIQAGLLVLIATPVARVALSLVGFVQQRDRMYIMITTIVLVILVFSLSGKLILK